MKKTIYRKIFTSITFAVICSAIINRIFFGNKVYFNFLLTIFAFLNFIIAWFSYLKLDSFNIPAGDKILNFLTSNMLYKSQKIFYKRDIYNESEDDEYVKLDISPEKYARITMLCYLASGLILLLISVFI